MTPLPDKLAALIPYYDQDGSNATLIYRCDGAVDTDKRTVKSNMRRLARQYCIDLSAARKNHGGCLGMVQEAPIPLSASLVLVPLKVRQAIGRNDGCCGYINPGVVLSCSPAEEKNTTILMLRGEHRVEVLYSRRTVLRRLKAGRYILENYRRQLLPGEQYAHGNEFAPPVSAPSLEQILKMFVRALAEKRT